MKNKKKFFAVFDSETCDLVGGCYDVAVTITDRQGHIYDSIGFLVAEIVTDAKKMMGAYYAGKTFSHYIPALDRGELHLKPWLEIRKIFNQLLNKYDVTVFCAYNLPFDMRAVIKTHEQLGYTGKWLNRKMDLLCLWKFACMSIFQQSIYKQCARQYGWISDAGNIRTNAEVAYKYLSTDIDFIESHTALGDSLIEAEILSRCLATRQKIPYNQLGGKTWQLVQED